jgi:hypothetical protein
MKKILLFVFALVSCLSLYAQKEVGTTTIYPRLGMNWSKFTNDRIEQSNPTAHYDSKYRMGFVGGVEVQHQFDDFIAGSAGVLYSRQGADFEKMEDAELSFKTDNILVPVLIVATTKIGLDFKLGVQPEFMVNSNADKILNKVNLSIPVGLAYEWNHIALDVRYNIGLTKVYKASDIDNTSKGSTFQLTIGYAFDI